MRPARIISGGQSGADQGGLAAAHALGIATGGWAPQDWNSEDGAQPALLRDVYGLTECDGGPERRTELNVRDSDGTAVFARDPAADGTAATIEWARRYGRPYITNPSAEELRSFVAAHGIRTLNIAGNRESVAPGIAGEAADIVRRAFGPEATGV